MSQPPNQYNPYNVPQQNPYGGWQKPGGGPQRPHGQPNQLAVALSIISLVTGIMSFMVCCCFVFLFMPITSIATGVPVYYMDGADKTSKGLATAGVIFASVFLTLWVCWLIFVVVLQVVDPNQFGNGRFRPQFDRNF